MSAPLAVVLQDSLPLVRIGLRQVLATRAGGAVAVEAEVADPASLPAACARVRADICLFELPPDPAALVAACRAARPGIRLVALHLGRRRDHLEVAEALDLRLLSYAAPPTEAVGTILGDGQRAATPLPVERRRHQRTLDARERALLRLAAEGAAGRELADRLGVDLPGLRRLTGRVLDLLDVDTLEGAVRLGRETGLVPRLRAAG